jgi:ABC-2 type transport system ATP-binding protein
MEQPIIETVGLSKHFGARQAVDGVTLSVPRGCAYGFLGHNGAGKTTTIRMLLGLTRPDAGTMTLRGHALPGERCEALSRVGAIVEEPRFHNHLSGRENLQLLAAVRGGAACARIDGSVERVGLRERIDERVGSYSQGMRQRLGIARCLLADPELLILDEPTNGLDPAGILEFRQLIASLVAEGRTVFLSSHLLDEVEKTCEQAAIIDAGRIVAAGPIAELARTSRVELIIECDERDRALALLARASEVVHAERTAAGVRLALRAADTGALLNRRLVEAGIAVSRLEPVRSTLEQRFLEVTSRLQGAA